MKINLNTSIFPIVNVGMYQSIISPEHIFDDWLDAEMMELMAEEEIKYCETASYIHFDFDAYKKIVAEYGIQIIRDFFDEIADTINIKLDPHGSATIDSPKYYNYRSDVLNFTVEVESEGEGEGECEGEGEGEGEGEEAIAEKIEALANNEPEFFNWLKKTYRSYDGFWCFMPNNREEFLEMIRSKDIAMGLAAYLTFLLEKNNETSSRTGESRGRINTYLLCEQIYLNHSLNEFIDDERFHEIITRVYDLGRV